MPADTPTLNRAANQMQSHGVCRFEHDDVWLLVREIGFGPVIVTPQVAALALRVHLSLNMQYWGVDANNCLTFREGAPPRMSGRKSKRTWNVIATNLPSNKPIHPWKNKRRPDDGEATNA